MKPKTIYLKLLFVIVLFSPLHSLKAQKVEAITISILNNGVPSQDIDSVEVFYSNSRLGEASPEFRTIDEQPFMFDSTRSIVSWQGGNSYYSTNITRTYDNNNNILTQVVSGIGSFINNKSIYTYTYDANSKLLTTLHQFINSGGLQNNRKDSIVYNGNSAIIGTYKYYWINSSNSWKLQQYTAYTYTANLLDETKLYNSNLQLQSTDKNFYTSNVLDSIYKYNSTSSTLPYQKDIYSYPSTNDVTIQSFRYSSTASGYRKYRMEKTKKNAQGQKIEVESVTGDYNTNTWQAGGNKVSYTYNNISKHREVETFQIWSGGMYTNRTQYYYVHKNNKYSYRSYAGWNTNTNSWDSTGSDTVLVYHYVPFNSTTTVETTPTKEVDIQLYPSPASSFITLNINWKEQEDFVIDIYNTQGQLVRQFGEQATKQYQKQIPLGGLPAGNYMLEVRSDGSRTVKQFSITP